MFFSKGTHLVFASFCAGVCVRLARGMPVHARKMWHAGLLTFVEEGGYTLIIVPTTIHVKGAR